jgi:hypothetical protein
MSDFGPRDGAADAPSRNKCPMMVHPFGRRSRRHAPEEGQRALRLWHIPLTFQAFLHAAGDMAHAVLMVHRE